MAFTFTTVFAGTDTFIATAFALDGDTTAVLTHNLGFSAGDLSRGPELILTPLGTAAYVGQWSLGAVTANGVTVNKINIAGGGGGGVAAVQIELKRPHTVGR